MLTDGLLLLKPQFATEYFGKIEHFTNPKNAGKIDDFFTKHLEDKIDAAKNIYSFDGVDARIRINGPLSVAGPDLFDIFFGFVGVSYTDIVAATELAAEDVDPKTGKVFFDFNTPGGTVDGVDKTFQAISALSSTHHTIAANHGDIASAGMWLASGCREIVAMTPVAFTGSIGVVVAGFDISQMLEDMGVKKVVITNHEATDKWPDISTESGQQIIRDELDAIYDVFASRVISGRKNMTRSDIDRLKGTMKVSKDALNIGLIDSISGVDVIKPPAAAGKPKEEASNMDLKALLAANPEAKTEYDAAITVAADTARAEGETAGIIKGKKVGIDEVKAVYAVALPILSSQHYPEAMKKRVGEKAQDGNLEGVKDYVSMFDSSTEGIATAKAIAEQGEETPATGPVTDSDKAESDFQAKQERIHGKKEAK